MKTEYELTINNIVNNNPITFSFECNNNIEIWQNNKIVNITNYNYKKIFNLYNYNKCVIKILV